MPHSFRAFLRRCLRLFATVTVLAALPVCPAAAQAQEKAPPKVRGAKPWTPTRTPWGDPDLQGTWTNRTITPLQRPADLTGKDVLTDEEAAAREEEARTRNDREPGAGNPGTYNQFWWEMGNTVAGKRSSLIVDPPDGLIPSLTPEAQRAILASRAGRGPADSWEDRTLFERCITRGLPGSMIPGFYNHNYEIVQTPGLVAIFIEMIHDVRLIPVDGRAHLDPAIRQWMGDSRGTWDGNTLVVETTNFSPRSRSHGFFESAGTLRLIERFTRVDANTIDYRFTLDDPATYTRPWTAAIPMLRSDEAIYEFACHEGNEAIAGILAGQRAAEKAAADKGDVKR